MQLCTPAAGARQRRAPGDPGATTDRVRSSAAWAARRALERRQTDRDAVYRISGDGLEGRTALSRLWGGVCRRIGGGPRSQNPCPERRPATQLRGGVVELGDAHGRIIPSGGLRRCVSLPASEHRRDFSRGSESSVRSVRRSGGGYVADGLGLLQSRHSTSALRYPPIPPGCAVRPWRRRRRFGGRGPGEYLPHACLNRCAAAVRVWECAALSDLRPPRQTEARAG